MNTGCHICGVKKKNMLPQERNSKEGSKTEVSQLRLHAKESREASKWGVISYTNVVNLSVFALLIMWVLSTYLNGGFFLKEALISGVIISVVLVARTDKGYKMRRKTYSKEN
ncbi:MAG: hypothetical protein HKN45_06325 [Flavobacteriales bacterium]|nr:hypothetical protein [Flavobacteriales bacterium]